MNDNQAVGTLLLAGPCWVVSMLAIALIWGGTALGIAMLVSVVVLILIVVWALK